MSALTLPPLDGPVPAGSASLRPPDVVVWHDLECGSYGADLPLWLELAREHPRGPILDVGAGTGRVTLALARAGRRLIALDRDGKLLATLQRRGEGLAIETVCADARDFELPALGEIELCVVPMQTLQLLGGARGRAAFMQSARAHMRAGALLACAIVTDLESFDCSDGGPGPSVETTSIAGIHYVSQATRVEVYDERIEIERRRSICVDGGAPAARPGRITEHRKADAPVDRSYTAEPADVRDVVVLDRLSAHLVEDEARALGWQVEPARVIAATAEHTGSEVVMLRV